MAADVESLRRPDPFAGIDAEQLARAGVLVGWVAVVAPFVAEIVAILRANHSWLLHRLPDDAFYYLQVGRNLAAGHGFTFDGVHETNGFHPLWQGLVVPFGWLFSDGDAYAKAVLVLGVVLSLVAVVIVVRVVADVAGTGAALFGALVAVHGTGVLGAWANGMEGPVVLLTLSLVLVALRRWATEPRFGNAAVIGALCSLAVLARLDLAAVLWIVPVAMALRVRSARVAGQWLAGAAAVGVPFALAWLARWGRPLTTSATVKRVWMSALVEERFGGRWSVDYLRFLFDTSWDYVESMVRRLHPGGERVATLTRLALGGLAIVGVSTAVGSWMRKERQVLSPAGWALVVLGLVVAVKAVVDIVSAPLWATAWYAAPQQLAFPLLVGVLAWRGVRAVVSWSPAVGVGVAALAIVLVLPTNLRDFTVSVDREPISGRWQDELDVAVRWVRDEGPDGRYGAYDAGLAGFELDGARTLVNLDGLVNNYEFAELVEADASAADRIAYTEVDYVVNRLTEERLAEEFACAVPIWRSAVPVPYHDDVKRSEGFVYVLDVRGCRT